MVQMRDFTWNYFSMTGDVDSYLLYKEIAEQRAVEDDPEYEPLDEDDPLT
jgi:hypothetical protein